MTLPAPSCGILGGTFDPIHNGHLAMARAATRACHLERVYFVPAPRPAHRAAPKASYADRYAMVALALAGQPRWLPLAIPDRGRATFALDQIAWLETWLAAHGRRERLHWIIGADAFLTLPSWHRYRQLLKSCDFIVLARGGITWNQVLGALPPSLITSANPRQAQLAGGRLIHWLGTFSSPASSTRLRGKLQRQPASQLKSAPLPARVAAYARRASLYHYAQDL